MDSPLWIFFLKEKLRENKVKLISVFHLSALVSGLAFGAMDYSELPEFQIIWKNKIPEKIQVGDRLLFSLKGLESVEETKILNFGFLALVGDEQVEVMDTGFLISHADQMEQGQENLFQLIPLSPAVSEFPPLIVALQDGKAVGRTQAFPMKVVSSFTNPQDPKEKPRDFIPPLYFPFPRDVIILAVVSALVLLFVLLGYFIRRYFKNKKSFIVVKEDLRREDEKILDALKELEAKGFIVSGNYKKHYFQASELFRRYIAFKYQFNAMDATSEEIFSALKEKMISDSFFKDLENLFKDLDKVKFARHTPDAEDAINIVPRIREYIQRTRIRT